MTSSSGGAATSETIRTGFLRIINSLYEQCLAVEAALNMGIVSAAVHGREYPAATFLYGAGHPTTPDRVIIKQIIIADIPAICKRGDGITRELFHARIVRAWYDYMQSLFEYQLSEYFAGRVSSLPTKLSVALVLDKNLIQSRDTVLQDAIMRDYSFAPTHEQLAMTIKALNVQMDDSLRSQIRKHTIVRNSLEHHGGIVRDKDLADLGVREITLSDTSGKPKAYRSNDRLRIEIYDIEDLMVLLEAASREFT